MSDKPHWEIYPHVPLICPHGSLRLLRIEPGWPGDPMRVRLISINERHANPPYEALSYTWGDPKITESIKCNGVEINVTISLANALRALRELPAEGEPSENGVCVISRDHPLHSENRTWARIARNTNEVGVIETRRARQSGQEKLFWIDALCINQEDLAECAAQVSTMRDIYSRAEKVRVFLGKELGPPEEIFTPAQLMKPVTRKMDKSLPKMTIQELGVEPLVLMFIVQALRNEDRAEVNDAGIKIVVEKGFPEKDSKEWNALRAFLELPWFYRVWIVQEIVLAREATMIIGNWEIEWDPFSRAIDVLDATNLPIPHHVRLNSTSKEQWTGFEVGPAHYLGSIRRTPGKKRPLYLLLVDALERGATNPRDHVYAVLAMVSEIVDPNEPPVHPELIDADYQKSVGHIFRDATLFILLNLYTLRFLTKAQLTSKSKELGCPSWVPNWAESRNCFPFLDQFFNASLKQPGYSPSCNVDPDVLRVPGCSVGKIAETTDVLEGNWKGWHYPPLRGEIDFVNASWKLASRRLESQESDVKGDGMQPTYYQSQDVASEALIYTLTANHNDESGNGRGDGDTSMSKSGRAWIEKYTAVFAKSSSGFKKFRSIVKDAVVAPEGVLFQSAYMRASVGRRFFLTEQGWMGIGPASLQLGDEVMVVLGVSVPMALRPVSEQQDADENSGVQNYVVVGECYVHGVMDGEVVEHQQSIGAEPQTLRLV